MEQDQVGRNALILLHLDDVADFHVLGLDGLHIVLAYLFIKRPIEVLVPLPSLEVVMCFFRHGHEEHECEWGDVRKQESYRKDMVSEGGSKTYQL